ncbi:hypothetical protein TUM4438_04920 [Shewanella sairae]|uniref:Transposase n=1 Tax=Shewanella sairae TaxID=190310 RepID=A0ABQ4P179_9GAMM|nr:hypothetical protein TUM4438_04920 [Shewanella sairae]
MGNTAVDMGIAHDLVSCVADKSWEELRGYSLHKADHNKQGEHSLVDIAGYAL